MRTWIVAFTLIFASCSTHYSSIQQEGMSVYEVIVGEKDEVLSAVYEAIDNEFPDTSITVLAGQTGYSFYHQPFLDRTNFDFVLKKVEAIGSSGPVKGFVYIIDTHGTQFFVNERYIDSLVLELKSVLMDRNITLIKTSQIRFID